jgi:hypothetical protein
MKSKLLLILTLAFLSILILAPATAQYCSDSVNTYLTFTDHSQNTLEITKGENVRLTSVAYSYNGPLWYEQLKIMNGDVLFTKYQQGTDNGYFHLFTNTYLLNSSTLEPGTYTIRFTASTSNDCSTEYSELTLIVNPSEHIEPPEEDDQCPIVDITFPTDGATYNELIENANFNVNENVKLESCSYTLNGKTHEIENCINGSNSLSDLITQEGSNTLTVYATDNSSNTCSDSVTFNIEFEEDDEENETCEDCCVEPDYYDYYYEENKTIKDYFWKTDNEEKEEIELELKFNPLTLWERFIEELKRILGLSY